jgi:hypothetical protein
MTTFIIIVIIVLAITAYILYQGKIKRERIAIEEEAEEKRKDEKRKEFTKRVNAYGLTLVAKGFQTIESDLNLKRNESLFVVLRGVKWRENRKVATGNVAGHGITGRIKIAKGIYYRYGAGKVVRESVDVLTTIDNGDLYITNQRLIYQGDKGNKTIPFKKILKLIPMHSGIKIDKDAGKDVYIPFDFINYPEKFAILTMVWVKFGGEQ